MVLRYRTRIGVEQTTKKLKGPYLRRGLGPSIFGVLKLPSLSIPTPVLTADPPTHCLKQLSAIFAKQNLPERLCAPGYS